MLQKLWMLQRCTHVMKSLIMFKMDPQCERPILTLMFSMLMRYSYIILLIILNMTTWLY